MAGANDIIIQGLIDIHLAGKGGPDAVAQMKGIVEQAKQVVKETGGMGAGIERTTQKVGLLETAFGKLGATVTGYFAAGVLKNFLEGAYVGFARTERQALAVENQLRSLGQAAKTDDFRKFIADLSEASGIIDDDLVPAFQRALGAFKNYDVATEVVGLASRFAAAGIGDVGTNVDAVARFFQTGMARGLTQLGINIKAGADGTVKLTEGFKLLREQAETLPKKLDDAQSRVGAAARAWDSFKDSVASALDTAIVKLRDLKTASDDYVHRIDKLDEHYLRTQEAQLAQTNSQLDAFDDMTAAATASHQKRNAAEKAFADQQKAIDDATADERLKKEKDQLAKIADAESKAQADLLRQRLDFTEKGSAESLAIQLELNEVLKAAAIRNAKDIGAATLDIEKFFVRERGKIRASAGESAAAKAAREEAAAFDPRAGFAEVEEAARAHEEELTRIAEEGLIARLQAAVDLSPEGSQEKLDAQLALERAQLKVSTDQKIRAAKKQADVIGAIQKSATEAQIALDQKEDKFDEDLANAKLRRTLSTTGQAVAALGNLFGKNKGFAIATAIINTALGITEVWTDKTLSFYEKLAATVTVAASGAAQIATIRSASIGGGGAASSGAIASNPKTSATNPNATNVNVSPATIAAVSGRSSASTGGTVVQIKYAFGDRQSMTKLAREIDKINRNNQSVLR